MPKAQSEFSKFVENRLKVLYRTHVCPLESKTGVIVELHQQMYSDVVKYVKENQMENVTLKKLAKNTDRKIRKKCRLYVTIQNLLLR